MFKYAVEISLTKNVISFLILEIPYILEKLIFCCQASNIVKFSNHACYRGIAWQMD